MIPLCHVAISVSRCFSIFPHSTPVLIDMFSEVTPVVVLTSQPIRWTITLRVISPGVHFKCQNLRSCHFNCLEDQLPGTIYATTRFYRRRKKNSLYRNPPSVIEWSRRTKSLTPNELLIKLPQACRRTSIHLALHNDCHLLCFTSDCFVGGVKNREK